MLALQPSARGLAYVLFEGPQSPVYLRMKDMRGRKKLAQTFEEVSELITSYEPEIVVLEDVLALKDRQLVRRKRLQRIITAYAQGRGLDVYAYTRADVRASFADAGAVKEGRIIDLARNAKIITDDVRKILKDGLDTRNTAAHPSDVKIARSKAISVIEDLVTNVIKKF